MVLSGLGIGTIWYFMILSDFGIGTIWYFMVLPDFGVGTINFMVHVYFPVKKYINYRKNNCNYLFLNC